MPIYKSKSDLDVLLEQYPDVFGSQLGELQGIEADIQVDCPARLCPNFTNQEVSRTSSRTRLKKNSIASW